MGVHFTNTVAGVRYDISQNHGCHAGRLSGQPSSGRDNLSHHEYRRQQVDGVRSEIRWREALRATHSVRPENEEGRLRLLGPEKARPKASRDNLGPSFGGVDPTLQLPRRGSTVAGNLFYR